MLILVLCSTISLSAFRNILSSAYQNDSWLIVGIKFYACSDSLYEFTANLLNSELHFSTFLPHWGPVSRSLLPPLHLLCLATVTLHRNTKRGNCLALPSSRRSVCRLVHSAILHFFNLVDCYVESPQAVALSALLLLCHVV